MAGYLKALVTIPMDSGIAEDASVNTWAFDNLTYPDSLDDIQSALVAFYTTVAPCLSVNVDGAHMRTRIYRMLDPEPRVPVLDETWNLGSTGTNVLPSECSVCVSFQGVRTSGEPQARRRGRVYIGPLAQIMASTSDPRPSTAALDLFETAAQDLLDTSLASSTFRWSVYSVADGALVHIDNGWIDNTFDTQRRRGIASTARRLFEA